VRAQTYTDDGGETMEAQTDIAHISRLLGVVDIVSVAPGDFLFKEEDKAGGFYIVRSGELQIIHGDIIYETIRAGDIVGEMAVVDETTRSASVLARTRAELVAVDAPGFLALVKNEPAFALTVMRVMSRRLRKMNRRYETAQITHPAAS
jgi:CRP/FNR family cyclic AMP-dependent transcriptional regulator